MHATPSNVTVELENSIAGCVAKMLGFQNVAVGVTPIKGKPEKTPYSMEALVEKNPEIIFITFTYIFHIICLIHIQMPTFQALTYVPEVFLNFHEGCH